MNYSTFVDGLVVDTNDPQQMGRVKVWCPAVDGENNKPENLPWARYISPFAGQAIDYPAGSGSVAPGPVSYGFWAIPKQGATVVIGFLYGDRNLRFYLGSFFPDHGNRSLPAGRNAAGGAPTSDSFETVEPTNASLQQQFNGNLSASQAKTRGAYERQVAQALTDKDGTEGYQQSLTETGGSTKQLDPQTYCITTPGRHALIMQDHPETGRVRIKTAEGHQVILDDANERIYVSTAKGNTWLELDQDGHVHIYAGADISMSTAGDFNVSAKGNVNIQAGGNINLDATGHAYLSACSDIALSSDGTFYATSSADMHLKAGGASNITSGSTIELNGGGSIHQTAGAIHLNGPSAVVATEAPCATPPSIVPNHEPWTRPASALARGKNWKE